MNNLSRWEEVRIFSYVFLSLSLVFFLLGLYTEAAGFGTDGNVLAVLNLLGKVIKDSGTVCGMAGGLLLAISEGWKRA